MRSITERPKPLMLISAGLLLLFGSAAFAVLTGGDDKGSRLSAAGEAVQHVEEILRDEALSPQERIEAALDVIEAEKAGKDELARQPAPQKNYRSNDPFFSDPWFDSDWMRTDWDPFAEMQRMRAMSRNLFANLDRQLGMMGSQGLLPGASGGVWSPSGDFTETDEAYIYRFDLPGVGEAQVSVTSNNNMLTIEGKRESHFEETKEDEQGNERTIKREIVSGNFKRTMPLPPNVDQNGITAEMEDGVLKVTLPKSDPDEAIGERVIEIR